MCRCCSSYSDSAVQVGKGYQPGSLYGEYGVGWVLGDGHTAVIFHEVTSVNLAR